MSIVSTTGIKSPRNIVICLHDYTEAKTGKQCKIGDRLEVYKEINEEWLEVLNSATNDITSIPRGYVADESLSEIVEYVPE